MKKVYLKEFEDKDIEKFKKWLNKEHIAKWYEEPKEWLDEVKKRNKEFYWINHFIVKTEEKDIGFCQYYEFYKGEENWNKNIDIKGTYSIDYLIGEQEYLKKGYGKLIIIELIDIISKIDKAKRIIVKPDEKNENSINTLLSVGFKFDKNNELYIYKY